MYCNILQHDATQHNATRCKTLQHTISHCNTATHCNALQCVCRGRVEGEEGLIFSFFFFGEGMQAQFPILSILKPPPIAFVFACAQVRLLIFYFCLRTHLYACSCVWAPFSLSFSLSSSLSPSLFLVISVT